MCIWVQLFWGRATWRGVTDGGKYECVSQRESAGLRPRKQHSSLSLTYSMGTNRSYRNHLDLMSALDLQPAGYHAIRSGYLVEMTLT